ncbi:hypothetical protein J6590_067086, partial [Homalodisca vitripennis]
MAYIVTGCTEVDYSCNNSSSPLFYDFPKAFGSFELREQLRCVILLLAVTYGFYALCNCVYHVGYDVVNKKWMTCQALRKRHGSYRRQILNHLASQITRAKCDDFWQIKEKRINSHFVGIFSHMFKRRSDPHVDISLCRTANKMALKKHSSLISLPDPSFKGHHLLERGPISSMALTHVSEVEVARVVHGLNMKTCRDIN